MITWLTSGPIDSEIYTPPKKKKPREHVPASYTNTYRDPQFTICGSVDCLLMSMSKLMFKLFITFHYLSSFRETNATCSFISTMQGRKPQGSIRVPRLRSDFIKKCGEMKARRNKSIINRQSPHTNSSGVGCRGGSYNAPPSPLPPFHRQIGK